MRVRIIFTLINKGTTLPFHHQNLLSTFIKNQLIGNVQQNYPSYNFSGLKGQTKVSRVGLHFYSSKVTLVVSSPSKSWIDSFLKSVFEQTEIKIGELKLIPESAELENEVDLSNPTKYVCISPIVIAGAEDTHAKNFISPEDDTFSDILYEVIIKQMEATQLYTPEALASFFKFQIVPDKAYLQKIKQEEKKFARIYTTLNKYNTVEFRGYTFPFTLWADEVVQRFVFECGLGCYNNIGFGMIDVTLASYQKTTTPYTILM